MSSPFKINKLKFVSFIYWLFLTYMIAAFIWWYVSLEKQNDQIANIQLGSIQSNDPAIVAKSTSIQLFQNRKRKQFLGEGVTFLFLFLLGAIYVYRSLLKQIRYSNQQQNFMMAVTHELKTPIAVTQLNIETLLKRSLSPEQQRQLLANSLKETQRLDSLCNNILLASQLDLKEYQKNKQEIDLTTLMQFSLKSFQERFPNRLLDLTIQEEVFIQGEPLLIQLMLNNLLDNANKYSPATSPISIGLSQNMANTVLYVQDQGEGIPVQEREKVFEKFYRVGSEFTRVNKGTGLGLFLCKKIAQFHKGQISIQDHAPKGSIFTFSMPNQA